MNSKYTELEQRMYALVAALQPPLTELHAKEVVHFLEVGEYGVALETAGAILKEEGLRPSPEALEEMRRLADEMEIDASDWRF